MGSQLIEGHATRRGRNFLRIIMIVVNFYLQGELLILVVLDSLQHVGLLRHSIVHQIGQVVVSADLAFSVLVRYIATLTDDFRGRVLRNQRA